MATFSVYNPATKRYDYYQAVGDSSATHASAPPRALLQSQLGATVEDAAWALPVGATKIGSGDLPQGKIAGNGASIGGIPLSWIAVGVGAYLLWRYR